MAALVIGILLILAGLGWAGFVKFTFFMSSWDGVGFTFAEKWLPAYGLLPIIIGALIIWWFR